MTWLIPFVVTLVSTLIIMRVEQKMTPAQVDGVVDLRDKSVGLYFIIALFSSMLVLPIYFFVRRGPVGIPIGLGLAVAVAIEGALVSWIVSLV